MSWREALERRWWAPNQDGPGWIPATLTTLYRAALACRDGLYRMGLRRPAKAPVPVVVVGNLIVGGAGKTPTTLALIMALKDRGWKPGVISRGYGRTGHSPRAVGPADDFRQCGDEPLLIRKRSGVPVWVAPRRIEAARQLCAHHPEVDVLVADDGLQHRSLHRDAQVIVFDSRGIGNGLLLPSGPLREPFTAEPPQRSITVYNASQPSTPWPGELVQRQLACPLPFVQWLAGVRPPPVMPQELRCQRVDALAGIADPERFFSMLEAAGLEIDRYPLPDHAPIRAADWPGGSGPIVLTEKDAVKIDPHSSHVHRLWVVPLDFTLPAALVDRVCTLLRSASAAQGTP